MAAVEANPAISIQVSLADKSIVAAGKTFAFEMADGVRQQFLTGRWDSTAELLEAAGSSEGPREDPRGTSTTSPSRVGSRPAVLAAYHRGKAWKPSQGFHINRPSAVMMCTNDTAS